MARLTALLRVPTPALTATVRFWAESDPTIASKGDGRESMVTIIDGGGISTTELTLVFRGGDDTGAPAILGEALSREVTSPSGVTVVVAREDRPPDVEQAPAHSSAASWRADQVCVDVPGPRCDDERRFWEQLTGAQAHASALVEFRYLNRAHGDSLRLLLQRIDDDISAGRSHLDLACGTLVDDLTEAHVEAGAEVVATREHWTTMRAPDGFIYCLTRRDPLTGTL